MEKSGGSNSAGISREHRFVSYLIERCSADKGLASRLRRADNPSTEYQSWDFLASMGVDLTSDYKRVPHALVSAAIVRSKVSGAGGVSLGAALASCFKEGSESEPGRMRLRRLLACSDLDEVRRVLRPILSFIASKEAKDIDYVLLLQQLLKFPYQGQRVKAEWAQGFYSGGSLNSAGGEQL